MNWRFRVLVSFVIALGLLIATTGGAFLLLHLRADEGGSESRRPDHDVATGHGAVCLGHVDVEGGVVSLYPSRPGRVVAIPVHEDESVKQGQVLLEIDDRPARFLVQQAEADLNDATAKLELARKGPKLHELKILEQEQAIVIAKQKLAAAESDYKHKDNLAKQDNIPKEAAEVAKDLVKQAQAGLTVEEKRLEQLKLEDPQIDISRAESDVEAKKAQLDQARFALEECALRSPAAGKVLRILVSKGEMLGSQPKQPAMQFCPVSPRIVRAEVEQEFADRVALGQKAEIEDDTSTGRIWQGKVIRISDWYTHRRSILLEPLQVNDVRTLECIVRLDRDDTSLRIGQRVRVHLVPTQ
jgi:multidrug resistance efflux pump